MSKNEGKRKDDDHRLPLFLGASVLALFLVSFLSSKKEDNQEISQSSLSSPVRGGEPYGEGLNRQISREMKLIERSRELRQLEVESTNRRYDSTPVELLPKNSERGSIGFDSRSDHSQERVYEALASGRREAQGLDDAESLIDSQLIQRQFEEFQSQEEREATARAFVEKARAAGLEIKLNSRFEIVSQRWIEGRAPQSAGRASK